MVRDPLGLLWDVRVSGEAILAFLVGRSREDYDRDEMLRNAVERRFTIIGEALGVLRKTSPSIASRVPALGEIVGLRNLLVHNYSSIDDDTIWEACQQDLPDLLRLIAALIAEHESGS